MVRRGRGRRRCWEGVDDYDYGDFDGDDGDGDHDDNDDGKPSACAAPPWLSSKAPPAFCSLPARPPPKK